MRQPSSTILGYAFSDPALLELALTHRSAGHRNNERLEFLGDGLLNALVAELLYERHPASDEGEMTRMRALLVNGDALADVAREAGFGDRLKALPLGTETSLFRDFDENGVEVSGGACQVSSYSVLW